MPESVPPAAAARDSKRVLLNAYGDTQAAIDARGLPHQVVLWDDPGGRLGDVRPGGDPLGLGRRAPPRRVLRWAERTAAVTALANPPAHLRWSSDKR